MPKTKLQAAQEELDARVAYALAHGLTGKLARAISRIEKFIRRMGIEQAMQPVYAYAYIPKP